MKRLIASGLVLFLLAACEGSATPTAVTTQRVAQVLQTAGATNVHDQALPRDTPMPRGFTGHKAFEIASIAPKGGQFFICQTKPDCDAVFAYFDALKGQVGPYLYQSPNGTAVVLLDSGLAPGEAAKYEAAVKRIP